MKIESSNLVGRMTVAIASQEWQAIPERGVIRPRVNYLNFGGKPTISLERLQVELSRRSSQVLSTYVDGPCDKLVTVVGHQFITLTVYISVQHGGRDAPCRAGLSAAAETCDSVW